MAEVTRREHVVRDVLGGVALLLVVSVGGYFASTLWGWAGEALSYLGEPVTVSRWWHWLLIGCLAVTALALARAAVIARPSGRPEYEAYCQDRFFGVVWRWNWSTGSLAPWCYCPTCDWRMVYSEDYDHTNSRCTCLSCEPCRFSTARSGNCTHVLAEVAREIDLKLRNGSWKHAVASPGLGRP